MPTSHTETYSIGRDGLADLALPLELAEQLRDALDGDRGYWIENEINDAITAKIQEHGVDAETNEWFGEWSAEQIVRDALVRPRT